MIWLKQEHLSLQPIWICGFNLLKNIKKSDLKNNKVGKN